MASPTNRLPATTSGGDIYPDGSPIPNDDDEDDEPRGRQSADGEEFDP